MTDGRVIAGPDLWSRAVALGRVVLPVGGVILLSSVFLLSSGPPPADAPAMKEAETILREGRLTAPDFTGVTEDGSAIRFIATRAAADPARAGVITAQEVEATLTKTSGAVLTVVARTGTLDPGADTLDLVGDVRVTGPRALDVRSERMTGRTDVTGLVSPGPVDGVHEIGTIEAGAMEATAERLDFTNGVVVVYLPPN